MIVTLVIGGIIFAFIAVLLIRTAMFTSTEIKKGEAEPISVDAERTAKTLAEMIRCKTVSDVNRNIEDEREFERFKKLLRSLFPNVYDKCTYEEPGDRSILLKWSGREHGSPIVLMAHYDVVSISEDGWEKPAFDGIIEDGVLWGRGAIDTKITLNGILSAAEQLISEGFVPQNDIYMAFGGDEEIGGHGAKDTVALFKSRGITPGMVLDEGGAVVNHVFPGVNKPCALIGIAEKGMLNVEYSVTESGGHSSTPVINTPIARLSKACVRMEKRPFKFVLTDPARKMLDTLARHSSFLYRLVFANLWCFAPLLNIITKKSGGELNALVRTTTAFTQMDGSKGMNVIPPYARMVSNHRIIPGETVDSVVANIKRTVNDEKIEVRVLSGTNPSRVSVTDCDGWKGIVKATSETWQDAIVSPYLMLACSDSRHFGEISDKVYRFSPMELTKEEREMIHGNNERIPVSKIAKTVEFYIRLIKNC